MKCTNCGEPRHCDGADRYDQEVAARHGVTKDAVQAAQHALDGDAYAVMGHLFPGSVADTEWVLAHKLTRMHEALQRVAEMMDDDALRDFESRETSMFPSDYWDGLGHREDAFWEGRRVGRSEAAALAREACDDRI